MTTNIPALDALQFHTQLQRLTQHEKTAQAEFLIWLAEFDCRDLYLALGYASLWSYCLEGLRYDEGQINLRTRAVHLLQRFPTLAEPLRDHRLSMSTIVVLGRVLDESNVADLIEKRLRDLPNQTAFVESAIRDALARTCPLCGGRGRLADARLAVSDFREARLPRLDRASALKLRQIVRFGRRMAATRLSLESARRRELVFHLARGEETLMSGRIGQGTGELVLEA